jgi:hypothetical protein
MHSVKYVTVYPFLSRNKVRALARSNGKLFCLGKSGAWYRVDSGLAKMVGKPRGVPKLYEILYQNEIDDDMFDFMRTIFNPLSHFAGCWTASTP